MSFSLPFDQIEAPSVTALAEQISARARRMQRQLEVAEGAAKPGAHALAIDEQRDRIEQRRQLLAQRKAARAAGLSTPPAIAKALKEVGGENSPGSADGTDPRRMFVALDALNAAAGNGEPSPRLTPREHAASGVTASGTAVAPSAPAATPVRFSLLQLVGGGGAVEAVEAVDAVELAAIEAGAEGIGGTMSTVKAMSTPAVSTLGRPSSLSKISPHTPTMKTPGPSRRPRLSGSPMTGGLHGTLRSVASDPTPSDLPTPSDIPSPDLDYEASERSLMGFVEEETPEEETPEAEEGVEEVVAVAVKEAVRAQAEMQAKAAERVAARAAAAAEAAEAAAEVLAAEEAAAAAAERSALERAALAAAEKMAAVRAAEEKAAQAAQAAEAAAAEEAAMLDAFWADGEEEEEEALPNAMPSGSKSGHGLSGGALSLPYPPPLKATSGEVAPLGIPHLPFAGIGGSVAGGAGGGIGGGGAAASARAREAKERARAAMREDPAAAERLARERAAANEAAAAEARSTKWRRRSNLLSLPGPKAVALSESTMNLSVAAAMPLPATPRDLPTPRDQLALAAGMPLPATPAAALKAYATKADNAKAGDRGRKGGGDKENANANAAAGGGKAAKESRSKGKGVLALMGRRSKTRGANAAPASSATAHAESSGASAASPTAPVAVPADKLFFAPSPTRSPSKGSPSHFGGSSTSPPNAVASSGGGGLATGRSGWDTGRTDKSTPTMNRELRAVGGTIVKKGKPRAEALGRSALTVGGEKQSKLFRL